jgi:hypothetical protein
VTTEKAKSNHTNVLAIFSNRGARERMVRYANTRTPGTKNNVYIEILPIKQIEDNKYEVRLRWSFSVIAKTNNATENTKFGYPRKVRIVRSMYTQASMRFFDKNTFGYFLKPIPSMSCVKCLKL